MGLRCNSSHSPKWIVRLTAPSHSGESVRIHRLSIFQRFLAVSGNIHAREQTYDARPQPRRFRTNVMLLLGALGVSLFICEAALRMTGRFQTPSYPPSCTRPELYQPSALYGYRLWPSRTTTYLYPAHNPRSLTVVSNREGFRSSREFDEPDERTRVMVVGDSFVFGEGVEESERFTNALEALQPSWRVDSLGMPGYGPDLMLRALEAVGLKSAPDVVVFSMYTDDFRRVHPQYAGAGFQIPRFKLESGQLVTTPYPKPRLWEQLSAVIALRHSYWRYTNAEFDLNAAILDRFLQLSESHSFLPAIIFLPGRADTAIDKARRSWLGQYAKRNAVTFLDLTEPIHKLARQQVFITRNWHLNPHGHQIVAIELHRFLAEQVLAKRSSFGRSRAPSIKQ
jgi:hypothetical protein